MNKDELKRYVNLRLASLMQGLLEYGDRDELIENGASGGNHDDTFSLGEDYGWNQGQIQELENILKILEETPDGEYQTN